MVKVKVQNLINAIAFKVYLNLRVAIIAVAGTLCYEDTICMVPFAFILLSEYQRF